MLIVKNTNVLEDYGFKREHLLDKEKGMWSYYYQADNFFLWVNPYLEKVNHRNKNQLVIEYFNEDIDEDIQEYMPQKMLNVIYRLINDDVVYIEIDGGEA